KSPAAFRAVWPVSRRVLNSWNLSWIRPGQRVTTLTRIIGLERARFFGSITNGRKHKQNVMTLTGPVERRTNRNRCVRRCHRRSGRPYPPRHLALVGPTSCRLKAGQRIGRYLLSLPTIEGATVGEGGPAFCGRKKRPVWGE